MAEKVKRKARFLMGISAQVSKKVAMPNTRGKIQTLIPN